MIDVLVYVHINSSERSALPASIMQETPSHKHSSLESDRRRQLAQFRLNKQVIIFSKVFQERSVLGKHL